LGRPPIFVALFGYDHEQVARLDHLQREAPEPAPSSAYPALISCLPYNEGRPLVEDSLVLPKSGTRVTSPSSRSRFARCSASSAAPGGRSPGVQAKSG